MSHPTTWRDSVIKKLRDRPRGLTLEQIAADVNVSQSWLRTLASKNGEKLNPTINTMEALDAYLTERANDV